MNTKYPFCYLWLALAVSQSGCAPRRSKVALQPLPPPAWHAESATIGVMAAGPSPPLRYQLPLTRGENAKHRMKQGFKSGRPMIKAAGKVVSAGGTGPNGGAALLAIPAGALAAAAGVSSAVGTVGGGLSGV